MKAFLEPLRELEELERLEAQLKKEPGVQMISGCIDPEKPHLIYGIGNGFKNKIIVTFSEQKAKELYEEYLFMIQRQFITRQKISCSTSLTLGEMY